MVNKSDEIKKPIKEDEDGDPFWSRILIMAIIVVWLALVGGNWIGHYIIQAGILAKKPAANSSEFKSMPVQKPKLWKQPVKVIKPSGTPRGSFDKKETPKPVKIKVTKTPKVSPSPTPAARPTPSPEKPSPKPSPTLKPSPTPRPSPTFSPKPKPSPSMKPSPSPKPSPTPEPSPTAKPSESPTPIETKEPASSPSPKPSPEKTTDDDAGNFSLQAGNYSQHKYATEQVDKLKAKGYSATVIKVRGNYKVYVGTFNSRSKAREVSEKMKADGFDSFVVSD